MRLALLALLSFLVISALPLAAGAATQADCVVCHNNMVGKVMDDRGEVNIRIDIERFQESVHGFMSCTDCHEKFDVNPHMAPGAEVTRDVLRVSAEIGPKAHRDSVALAACYKCHTEIYESVLGSVHGQNIVTKGKPDGPLCLDCHGSPHYLSASKSDASPVSKWRVVETCGDCHRKDGVATQYGANPNVMTSYDESFHGKKHMLKHKGAPTCVDCHGYHDVRGKDDPASPVFGTNKLETCGGCHAGANEKFIPAITHKEAGPIPHYGEKGLILLAMSVFAFIIIHVILEAFSDIRDAFFRKEQEVHHAKTESE